MIYKKLSEHKFEREKILEILKKIISIMIYFQM